MNQAHAWECSHCKRPITDHEEGYLIADDDLKNWRVVHRLSCDPDTGPWHPLAVFIGKRGAKNFRQMQKIGAFTELTPVEVEQLRALVVRESFDGNAGHRIAFRQWLRQQEQRDDPIGDLARDMARDKGQNSTNPSLNDLYHWLSIQGASRHVLNVLVEAYREWQSYGNTYRETRPVQRKIAPKHKAARLPKISKARAGWLALRFRILKRDGYRCQICGATAQDGVKLEVDHKIPRSKGGTDDETNLWCLCFDCNRGKRDQLL